MPGSEQTIGAQIKAYFKRASSRAHSFGVAFKNHFQDYRYLFRSTFNPKYLNATQALEVNNLLPPVLTTPKSSFKQGYMESLYKSEGALAWRRHELVNEIFKRYLKSKKQEDVFSTIRSIARIEDLNNLVNLIFLNEHSDLAKNSKSLSSAVQDALDVKKALGKYLVELSVWNYLDRNPHLIAGNLDALSNVVQKNCPVLKVLHETDTQIKNKLNKYVEWKKKGPNWYYSRKAFPWYYVCPITDYSRAVNQSMRHATAQQNSALRRASQSQQSPHHPVDGKEGKNEEKKAGSLQLPATQGRRASLSRRSQVGSPQHSPRSRGPQTLQLPQSTLQQQEHDTAGSPPVSPRSSKERENTKDLKNLPFPRLYNVMSIDPLYWMHALVAWIVKLAFDFFDSCRPNLESLYIVVGIPLLIVEAISYTVTHAVSFFLREVLQFLASMVLTIGEKIGIDALYNKCRGKTTVEPIKQEEQQHESLEPAVELHAFRSHTPVSRRRSVVVPGVVEPSSAVEVTASMTTAAIMSTLSQPVVSDATLLVTAGHTSATPQSLAAVTRPMSTQTAIRQPGHYKQQSVFAPEVPFPPVTIDPPPLVRPT